MTKPKLRGKPVEPLRDSAGNSYVLRSTEEAAARIRASATTLETWRSARCGPRYVKIGGRVFYRDIDLDAYVESQMVEPQNGKRHRGVVPSVAADGKSANSHQGASYAHGTSAKGRANTAGEA